MNRTKVKIQMYGPHSLEKGWAEFATAEDATKALQLDGHMIRDQPLQLSVYVEQQNQPKAKNAPRPQKPGKNQTLSQATDGSVTDAPNTDANNNDTTNNAQRKGKQPRGNGVKYAKQVVVPQNSTTDSAQPNTDQNNSGQPATQEQTALPQRPNKGRNAPRNQRTNPPPTTTTETVNQPTQNTTPPANGQATTNTTTSTATNNRNNNNRPKKGATKACII